MVDLCINFVTARWTISVDGTPHWVLVDNLSDIAVRYLRGMFCLDLIGAIPWQFFSCGSGIQVCEQPTVQICIHSCMFVAPAFSLGIHVESQGCRTPRVVSSCRTPRVLVNGCFSSLFCRMICANTHPSMNCRFVDYSLPRIIRRSFECLMLCA